MAVTRNSLQFTWGDAEGQYSDFVNYLTRVEDSSTGQVQTCTTTCVSLTPGEDCSQQATCANLIPGQEYCITVRIVREFNTDVTRMDCKRTSKTLSF